MKRNTQTGIPPVSDALIARVTHHRASELEGVVKVDPAKLAKDYLDLNRARELYDRFRHLMPARDGKLLEIGSGFGSLVAYALNWENVHAYGIEPDKTRVEICHDLLKELELPSDHIVRSVGEAIPLASNSLDLICSFTVFEHVQNPQSVLKESIRVLKPGGFLYFSFPNYGSWWEGHYAILWLPNIPKWFAKVYVHLLGRDPAFLDHLQLINYRNLQKWLKELSNEIEVIGFGQRVWEERLRTLTFSEWAQLARLKQWVRILQKLRLVNLLIVFGRWLHWETPFILVLRKK